MVWFSTTSRVSRNDERVYALKKDTQNTYSPQNYSI